MATLKCETVYSQTVADRRSGRNASVRTIWFCTYEVQRGKWEILLDGHKFHQARAGSPLPSWVILSLNDLNHITMADTKVESVQTFGRKVHIGCAALNLGESVHEVISNHYMFADLLHRKPRPLLPS